MTQAPREKPTLNRADAWLLAALTEGSHDGRSVTLPDFLHDTDWLNRLLPTFDELSFGLPRLIAAGLLTVDNDATKGMVLQATPEAIRLGKSARRSGNALGGMTRAVGARVYPDADLPEDRSCGRLPGFEPEDLEAATTAYKEWFDRASKPYVAVGRLLAKLMRRGPAGRPR